MISNRPQNSGRTITNTITRLNKSIRLIFVNNKNRTNANYLLIFSREYGIVEKIATGLFFLPTTKINRSLFILGKGSFLGFTHLTTPFAGELNESSETFVFEIYLLFKGMPRKSPNQTKCTHKQLTVHFNSTG